MNQKAQKASLSARREERGAVVLLAAVLAFALMGAAAISYDLGLARIRRLDAQVACDAGALAGVTQLMQGQTAAVAQTEARNVASINLPNGIIQSVEIGRWDGANQAFVTTGLPNAVRIFAAQSVPTVFSRVWGQLSTTPRTMAIATYDGSNDVNCLIPFGLEDDSLVGKNYGDTMTINHASPGNWGKLDIGGNMSSNPVFLAAMASGACSATVSIGDLLSPGTGFAGVVNGFDSRIASNPIVTMPIVNGFSNGNSSPVTVVGFVVAQLILQNGNGQNWSGQIRLLNEFAGNSSGGSIGAPGSHARFLVQ